MRVIETVKLPDVVKDHVMSSDEPDTVPPPHEYVYGVVPPEGEEENVTVNPTSVVICDDDTEIVGSVLTT